MNTELYIEGYRLDLTTEISALLNFAIDDIKNFSSRSTTWSRTIVLPGTANNNRQFGHIFQVGQSNNYNGSLPNVGFNFNAAKAAPCILFQDQIQTFKGVLRLLQVNYYDGLQGRIDYEVSVFGTISGLNSALTGSLLENLDFQAYNAIFNINNIVNSWDNPGGSGVYYPLIDYGTFSANKHDWDYRTFRPALYAKEYIDKMFPAAGYRYQCPLFDTPRFKSFIVPHNQKELRTNNTIVGSGGLASDPGVPFLFNDNISPDVLLFNQVPFSNFNSSIFSGSNTPYLPGWNTLPNHFVYTDTPTVTLTLKYTITGHYYSSNGFQFAVTKNNTIPNGTIGTTVVNVPGGGDPVLQTFVPFTISGQVNVLFATSDFFEMGMYSAPTGNWDVRIDTTSIQISSATSSNLLVPVQLGQSFSINDMIPKNIRQIDFLVGIVKLFNLYVYEDKNDEHLIYITPYIDFYSKNFSNAVDWTHKLNNNKPVKSKPMSELNAKIYKFKFKQDGDYYNDLYRKRYNEGYGDRIYDSEFEFSAQTSEFEICFSATPLVGYNGEDKVYSTIFKRNGTEPNVTEENLDSNIRLLQTKKVTGVTSWSIKDGATVLNTLTRYGYAGHLDDPDIPTNDLNFGAPKELFFILSAGNLSDNQFNVYWSNYMREITDKDSKLVTANFYLSAVDILNLDFSKYVYVDGIAYRLNAIKDYNITTPTDCVVELLKVNAASYTESSSNNGPPDGCYLLWSDDNTLDWTNSDALLYGDCATNPGDGGGGGSTPPVVHTLTWSWNRIGATAFAIFRIYVDDVLFTIATANGSGTFNISDGQVIKVEITGSVARLKRIFESNSVDGVEYDNTTSGTTVHTYTFTVDPDKDYTVNGSVQNP